MQNTFVQAHVHHQSQMDDIKQSMKQEKKSNIFCSGMFSIILTLFYD